MKDNKFPGYKNPPKPPPKKEIKYLKVSELEVNKYYTCALSGLRVFVNSINIEAHGGPLANCIYYYEGEYFFYYFADYMLY